MRVNSSYLLTLIALALSIISAQAQSFTNTPLNISATSPILINDPFTFTFTVTGFSQGTLNFTVPANELPSGLTLSTAGVISGAPTAVGTFTGTVTATDGTNSANQAFTIVVGLATIPEGMMTLTIPASSTAYVSFPLSADPVYSDEVLSVTANALTVSNASAFTVSTAGNASSFSCEFVPGTPYFVKFLSGLETGRVILVESFTASSLTLDTTDNTAGTSKPDTVALNASGFSVQPGDTFEVFQGDTLESFFGNLVAGDTVNLSGGTKESNADTVAFFGTSTDPLKIYFYNTSAAQWQEYPAGTAANSTIIYPGSAVAIKRRGATNATLSFTGRVPEVPLLIKTVSATTSFSSSQYPVDMTLSQLQLGPNWYANPNLKESGSDALGLFGATSTTIYYQQPAIGLADPVWYQYPTGSNANSVSIPAGTALIFNQRLTVTGGSTFLQVQMPYSF